MQNERMSIGKNKKIIRAVQREVAALIGARRFTQSEGKHILNACLSFTLRAVRAYVRVWGVQGASKKVRKQHGAGARSISK